MISKHQGRYDSDQHFCLFIKQAADGHDQTVIGTFRGGKRLTVDPGTRLEEVEASYREAHAITASGPYALAWRTPAEIAAQEAADVASN